MYAPFFGLKHEPFSIAPDPRYLFMSERHREALAHLLYGVKGGGGFVLLTGEIGAGKTTVCRCFLEQVPKRCNVAYIFNPKLTVTELLKTVCDEFRVPVQHQGPGAPTVKDYVDPLNEFLLKTHAIGLNNVLVIDEAQNLSADVLEQLRLLTNLETNERKLLQIVLIGQPELREMLARPELEQLAQRVIARFHLGALSEKETVQYIRHRLAVAGMSRATPFDKPAMRRVHQLARGVPRRINLLCDRALLGAYATGHSSVDRQIVDKAASEVFDTPRAAAKSRPPMRRAPMQRLAYGALAVAAGAVLWGMVTWAVDDDVPSVVPATAVPIAKAAASSASAPGLASAAAPASAASAPAVLASADFASALATLPRDPNDAWRALAPAWKLSLGDADPCEAARQQQVQCFRSPSTTLALIRQLARPGILTLRDGAGQPAYALLDGLGERHAMLRIGGVARSVPLPVLAQHWRGEFATFWRVPPGTTQPVVDAGSAPLGGWLAERLARLSHDRDAADTNAPATSLRSRIVAFQVAQGLPADGVAGPITLMQVNRATGVDEPRLQTES